MSVALFSEFLPPGRTLHCICWSKDPGQKAGQQPGQKPCQNPGQKPGKKSGQKSGPKIKKNTSGRSMSEVLSNLLHPVEAWSLQKTCDTSQANEYL